MIANHISRPQQPDQIVFGCPEGSTCYKHSPVTYKVAREHIFGEIHLKGSSPDTYSLVDSYCDDVYTNKDFPVKSGLAPLKIPDTKVLNTEHVWPQSKFSKSFPENLQKSDIHILLPIASSVNSTRSNHPFGEVATATSTPCESAALGKSPEGRTVFEPSENSKGNVARAIFYFSIRYKMPIDADQEKYLRLWHEVDPVDSEESQRNEAVFKIQKNRNPFIDSPDLTDHIADF